MKGMFNFYKNDNFFEDQLWPAHLSSIIKGEYSPSTEPF